MSINLEKMFQDAVVAFQNGNMRKAERLLKKVDQSAPRQHSVLHLRGLVALNDKRFKNAIHYLKRAVSIQPSADLLSALGNAYNQSGAIEDAISVFSRVVQENPNNSDAKYNLGNALRSARQHTDALSYYEAAIAEDPCFADAYYNMGISLKALSRDEEAIRAYARCLELNPNDAEAMKNLANILYIKGDLETAHGFLEKVLTLMPNDADAHFNLANVTHAQGKMDTAFAAFESAIRINPAEKSYLPNFALLLKDLGEVDAAITQLQALHGTSAFTHSTHSNLIFCMLNRPTYGSAEIRAEASRWQAAHVAPLAPDVPRHTNTPDPTRKLKLGYLSGDFRQHPVGFFMELVFEAHDRDAFEVHAFSTHTVADDVSERIKAHVAHWHDVGHLEGAALANAIRDAGMDIVIELSGHAAHNRLQSLAYRPAPLQFLGGGQFCTSGLNCIDGFISDRFETPDGFEDGYTEPVIRLPNDYICYRPSTYAAEVAPSPCLENGYVTFGCFNNLSKISEPAVALWAEIMKQVPESRLLLKTTALSSTRAQERLRDQFGELGIGADCLLLESGLAHEAFLAEYARVDIALDPFPYSGGLTTLEALWMGVPVITLPGETFSARHSMSHLSNVGLTDLICYTPNAYAEKVVALASDHVSLNKLRQSIRGRMAASSVLDGVRYTQNLEAIYHTSWKTWCDGQLNKGLT